MISYLCAGANASPSYVSTPTSFEAAMSRIFDADLDFTVQACCRRDSSSDLQTRWLRWRPVPEELSHWGDSKLVMLLVFGQVIPLKASTYTLYLTLDKARHVITVKRSFLKGILLLSFPLRCEYMKEFHSSDSRRLLPCVLCNDGRKDGGAEGTLPVPGQAEQERL